MILLLGATGYVGQAFARVLRRRKDSFIPLSQSALDYTCFELLFDYVRKIKPVLVINGAESTTETPNGDPNEFDRMEMLQANTLLPQTVARVCEMTNTVWGHVSSGSIYSGAKILENGHVRIERNLAAPGMRKLFEEHAERFCGFTETDRPNSSFLFGPCTFYSGTKALAEEAIRGLGQNYIWRFRLPFDEQDLPDNFLSKVMAAHRFYDAVNSLSHLDDCIGACLELWERQAPFGTYNVTNPGAVTTRELAEMIRRILKVPVRLELLEYENRAWPPEARTRYSDCILDTSKLVRSGVRLRPVKEALEKSLQRWKPLNGSLVRSFWGQQHAAGWR